MNNKNNKNNESPINSDIDKSSDPIQAEGG